MRISDWSSDVCSSDLSICGCCVLNVRTGAQVQNGCDLDARTPHGLRNGVGAIVVGCNDDPSPGTHAVLPQVSQSGVGQHDSRPVVVRKHRSEEHTSELQSLMRTTYDVLRLKKKQED